VVNFNYVSSPKFVPNQKDFIISAACVSRFRSCQSFWSFSTSPSDGQTRLLAPWKQIHNSSCRQVFMVALSFKYFRAAFRNRNHNMIIAEISRFMDEDVQRCAYVVCLGQNVDEYNNLALLTAVWQ